MVRDTHTLRRSILSHLEQTANYTSIPELEELFPSASSSELQSAVNFLKMVKMVEVEEGLIAKTDTDHATPVAQLYNRLKVGKTYDRKAITVEVKNLKLPVSPANAVKQLVQHGGLNKKSGNSFECLSLPSLLGVTQVEEEVAVGEVEIVSANRRVVWMALSEEPMTRDDLYDSLIPIYPSLNKTKIGQNLSLLAKQGCIDLDHDTKLATQLDYVPFEVDLFYHEIKGLKTITFSEANKICSKVGLNSKPSNLLNSLVQFDAIKYTDKTGIFDVLPLPQLEEVDLMELLEEVEEPQSEQGEFVFEEPQVEPTSVEALLTNVKQAKQAYNQLIQEHDLKVKEVHSLRKQIEELTKKANELEGEIHSEVNLAKQKLEQAQTAFKQAISVEGLIG